MYNQQLYDTVNKSLDQTINYAYYFVNYYTGLSTDDITVLNDWSLAADTAHRSNCIGNGSFHGSIRVDTPGIYSIYSLLQFRRSHSYVQRLMIKSADSPNIVFINYNYIVIDQPHVRSLSLSLCFCFLIDKAVSIKRKIPFFLLCWCMKVKWKFSRAVYVLLTPEPVIILCTVFISKRSPMDSCGMSCVSDVNRFYPGSAFNYPMIEIFALSINLGFCFFID
jgi:hypothetical protein